MIDTAYSILDSWKKNYDKGKRKRNCPIAKRLFVRIKQTLMKVEEEKLRIFIKPYQFIYINLYILTYQRDILKFFDRNVI